MRYAVVLHDCEILIAVAVAIGQAKEPDLGQLQDRIKFVAPVVPYFDTPAFINDQIEESIAVEVASPQVNEWNGVTRECGYG